MRDEEQRRHGKRAQDGGRNRVYSGECRDLNEMVSEHWSGIVPFRLLIFFLVRSDPQDTIYSWALGVHLSLYDDSEPHGGKELLLGMFV